jgi:hypothetical protein
MNLKNLTNFLVGIRGPETVLEKLEYDGFVEMQTVSFPEDKLFNCVIYGRGKERVLYHPQENRIVSRYIDESTNQRRKMSQV